MKKLVKVARAAQQCYEITQSKLSPALSLFHFKFTYVLESDAKKKKVLTWFTSIGWQFFPAALVFFQRFDSYLIGVSRLEKRLK